MNEPSWIEYITAIGSIATPILVGVIGVLGWKFRAEYERRVNLETLLRTDRVQIYNTILEPFIIMFMADAAWQADAKNKNKDKFQVGMQKALSLDYRRTAFQLALLGSDDVVQAYNDLMQHIFHLDQSQATDAKVRQLMGLIGRLLLQIRKSMGNESTALDEWAMLEWFITDAPRYRDA